MSVEAKKELAQNGARSLLDQVLSSGFFHADPHAGNIAVTPVGRICFFDWGMVGQLTRRMRHHLTDHLIAAIDHDAVLIVSIANSLSYSGKRINDRKIVKEIESTLA